MQIKHLPSSTLSKLVADFKRISESANKTNLAGQVLEPNSAGSVVVNARPEIPNPEEAENISSRLQGVISSNTNKALAAVGELDSERIKNLLED